MNEEAKECLKNANEFYYLALKAKNNSNGEMDTLYLLGNFSIAYTVNLVFSSELYLKYLLLKNNIEYETEHSLVHLFQKLPNDIESYDELFKLSDELTEIDNYFNLMRYSFEKEIYRINITAVEHVSNVLNVISNKK